jgi:hypothetical protein
MNMDEQAMMGEKHLMDENMGQSHPIEPSVDAQAPEGAMDMSEAMPSEPAIEEQPTDAQMNMLRMSMPMIMRWKQRRNWILTTCKLHASEFLKLHQFSLSHLFAGGMDTFS